MLEQSGASHENLGKRPQQDLQTVLREGIDSALQTDQYEVASSALSDLRARREWRGASSKSSFRQFYQLFEGIKAIEKASISPVERQTLRQEFVDSLASNIPALSPRVRDLYEGLLAETTGEEYSPHFEMTERQLQMLKDSGDLKLLQNPNVPMEFKINRMKNRIESELMGRKALDSRDKAKVQEEKSKDSEEDEQQKENQEPPTPPPDSDESKPSMDEMERLKEGEEAQAIWTITPAYGGYYKEQSFDVWDPKKNVWKRDNSERTHVNKSKELSNSGKSELTIKAQIPMLQYTRLPTPYRYKISNIKVVNSDFLLVKDSNGDYLIRPKNQHANVNPHEVTIEMVKKDSPAVTENPPAKTLHMPAKLSEETEKAVDEIKQTRKSKIEQARGIASYTMKRLEYSNDSSYNVLYENYQDGYFAAIDAFKKADCDVANTYFAALCSKLGIPVRHVVGHMVKGKDQDGNSRITSGTGHAWTEVWDNGKKEWIRIDATPAGDPQLEEDQNDNAETPPGDYGEKEAVGPSDEELEKLEEQLSNLAEKLSYTSEERHLSEATGVDLKEAREIVREINKAEDSRFQNGEKVVDVLSQLFNLIVESRKTSAPGYTGPLRKREGGEEIDDIVAHKIGIKSGEADPASRQKPHVEELVKEVFGGFDVHIIGDKSGSMSYSVFGEYKWQMQRRAEYLILSSLHRFEQNIKKARVKMIEPLSVRTQGISFRGSGPQDIDEDKSLSSEFTAADKVRLWHSLGNQGGGNGDVPALNVILGQIQTEKEETEKAGKKDTRLRIIIACSDGMPDSPEKVHEMAKILGEMGTLVVGIGLTETASQVPIIFNTPYSRGDIARDINDLPAIVAKHIVMEATKLFPEKTKMSYQKLIDSILAKFQRV